MSPSLQCGEREVGDESRCSDKNRGFGSADIFCLLTSDCDADNYLLLDG